MLKRIWLAAGMLVVVSLAARIALAADAAKIDTPVKDFTLTDLWTSKPVAFSEMKGKPVLIVFISYNCDVTWRYEKRIGQLMQSYMPKGVKFLAVRSSANDSVDGIKRYAEAKNFTMPLLHDERNVVADYFNVQVTPTFVLVDEKGILRYQGSCDDNRDEATAKKTFVRDALDAVLAGKEVAVKQNRAFG
jgi:peroxiredoxin